MAGDPALVSFDSTLRLYAIVRQDLAMGPGKTASQAGHAFIGAFLKAAPPIQAAYHSDGIGTKVCLVAANLDRLRQIYEQAVELGLPAVIIEDTGNNTIFNGVPTITAVGIGPVMRHEAPFLRKLQLHR